MRVPIKSAMTVWSVSAVTFAALLFFLIPLPAGAHSGGLNAQGCHAGSQPYHCHRPQVPNSQNSPPVNKSRTGICHIEGSRYYLQTKKFTPFNNISTCLASGGRLPK